MQPLYSSLTDDEKEVFRLYKGNKPFDTEQCFTDHLNTTLGKESVLPSQWEGKAQLLDSIIAKSSANEDVLLYRATIDEVDPIAWTDFSSR